MRVILYGFDQLCSQQHLQVEPDKTMLIHSECNAIWSFFLFRHRPKREHLHRIPIQPVVDRLICRFSESGDHHLHLEPQEEVASIDMLQLKYVLPPDPECQQASIIHLGANALLRLCAHCHHPYPLIGLVCTSCVPAGILEAMYQCFVRNRHIWFGRLTLVTTGRSRFRVDEHDKEKLVAREAVILCGTVFLGFCWWHLPQGSRMKDGTNQQFARATCATFVLLLCLSDFWPSGTCDSAVTFSIRFVGPASAQSLAAMRVSCSLLLLAFTSDHMTAPLEETAKIPRWMCRPTGVIRVLYDQGALGDFLGDVHALRCLERLTRVTLGCVMVGVGMPVASPCAAVLWIFYGGVFRAYNTWRGHSFIAAWWTLVVIAWRGGAADAASLDLCLQCWCEKTLQFLVARKWWFTASIISTMPGKHPCAVETIRAVDRGWTRFIVTLIFANNYFMAGLSKLCASGVAWASGENLKAKLLQTTLVQTSFGCHLTLFCRRLPNAFFGVLGACGLYGELAMSLVPFFSLAKLFPPIFMWGMHVGIAALQHIIFLDLLCFIPAWYLWHALDHNLMQNASRRHVHQHPWDWNRWVIDSYNFWCGMFAHRGNDISTGKGSLQHKATQRFKVGYVCTSGLDIADPISLKDMEVFICKIHKARVRAGSMWTALFMLIFLGVWARGAEWLPYNSFRMFAGWTPRPIFYERYIALDADGGRMRNFHYHEINPVLNRKRLIEALNLCADKPESADCLVFLDFAIPRSAHMRGRPAALVVQTRSWDFVANIDNSYFCDSMDILALDIEARIVTRKANLPCDAIDLRACCASTIGTI